MGQILMNLLTLANYHQSCDAHIGPFIIHFLGKQTIKEPLVCCIFSFCLHLKHVLFTLRIEQKCQQHDT